MMLPPVFLTTPFAHRGLHDKSDGAPENGMTAFRRAVAAGYGIELDLQVSADGVAMVFHDDTLDRMTGQTGATRARTANELSGIRLLDSDDTIPPLAQVIAEVAGRVPLLIELKDQSGGRGGTDGALEAGVAAALSGYGGPVALMSFNPDQVAHLSQLLPDTPRGLTTCFFRPDAYPDMPPDIAAHLRDISDFDRVGAAFISHDVQDLTMQPVAALKAAGVPILCWTVRSPEAEATARQVADNITFERYLPAVAP